MLKRFVFVIVMLVLFLLTTGCWDRKEVNDLAIVLAAGVDKKGEDKIELSLQLFAPLLQSEDKSQGGGSQGGGEGMAQKAVVFSATGFNVADAISNLQAQLSREIFWGHATVIIFGEKLAKQEVHTHVDFFMRDPRVREGTYVFVAKGKANDLLNLQSKMERNVAELLRKMAKQEPGLKITMKDFSQMLSTQSEAAIVPWVETATTSGDKGPLIRSTGAAIIKNGKLVGHVDEKVVRGIQWLRNEIKAATITMHEKQGYISAKLIGASASLVPNITGDDWSITAKISVKTKVKQNGTKQAATSLKFIAEFEEMIQKEIEEKISNSMKQVQHKMKADVFGFSDTFRRGYPKEWQKVKDRWDEKLPEIEIVYDISAKIESVGMTNLPAGVKEEEVQIK